MLGGCLRLESRTKVSDQSKEKESRNEEHGRNKEKESRSNDNTSQMTLNSRSSSVNNCWRKNDEKESRQDKKSDVRSTCWRC